MIKLLNEIIDSFFGFKCPHCGKRNTKHGYWSRGHNYLCDQAYGDYGYYCNLCNKITWQYDIKEHMSNLPNWCEPYELKGK